MIALTPRRRTRVHGFLVVILAYAAALLAATYVARTVHFMHPVVVAAAADLAATFVVFAFSVAYDNSSLYDPYWSVAPPVIALYWAAGAAAGVPAARQTLVLVLVAVWAARLTANWGRGWRGLGHEDWRYVDLRERTGRAYWLVSFTGLHLAPTAIVFLACLPLHVALARPGAGLGLLDLAAAVVTAGAIAIEAVADEQLRRFRATAPPGVTLEAGLWAYSRHPNYFGEGAFWWGLWLFGLAAGADPVRSAAGAALITLMLLGVSIPMIDRRMLARRPGYAARMRRVSALVPWFPRS